MTENQRFELAVLLEKLSLVNGMLVNGSTEQKKQARKELQHLKKEVSPFLYQSIFMLPSLNYPDNISNNTKH